MSMLNLSKTWVLALLICVALVASQAGGKTIYVDDNAGGSNNGTGWPDAYRYLQDGLADANSSPKPVEVWVAQGIYKPDRGTGITLGDREATFALENGVSIYGGFPAGGGNWERRDPNIYETILSGDLTGNDVEVASPELLLTEPSRAENSYHVVAGGLTDDTAVLDGFTIAGGNANSSYSNNGGGMFNFGSSPNVVNCTFSANSAGNSGGGMYNDHSSLTLTNCTFSGNLAGNNGGGMYNDEESYTPVTDCTFSGNSALYGGGIDIDGGSATFISCTFSENTAGSHGGGMSACNVTVTNCTFTGNSAGYYYGGGGGIHIWGSSSTVTDCTFTGNSGHDGGGMCNGGSPTVTNCTFSTNSGSYGGGMCNWYGSPAVIDCTFSENSAGEGGGMFNTRNSPTITNCTYSENSALIGGGMYDYKSSTTLNNCTFCENSALENYYGGGGIYASSGELFLKDCTISKNSPSGVRMYLCDAHISGINQLVCNDWAGEDIRLDGDGTILLHWFATLDMETDDHGSYIACNIAGPGDICILSYGDLTIEDDAVIDLGYEVGPNGQYVAAGISLASCQPLPPIPEHGRIVCDSLLIVNDNAQIRNASIDVGSDSELVIEGQARIEASEIQCDGLLRARENAQIVNANINVTRASFEGDIGIFNSVITAEAGAPYGQFFIEDSVRITGNDIHADGDRYMDLDPAVFEGLIQSNKISVTITEGVGQSRGGLFELRGRPDLAGGGSCDPNNPFFCNVASIPDFDPNSWMIEELTLINGAKVNLTNRFDFQTPFDSGGEDEVLYVRNLILGQGAILNTAFNCIYYQNLYADPCSVVTNEPLLGFSLCNIAFDDDIEFLTRVTHNNYIHPTNPLYDRVHVERVEGFVPDPNGMMRMRNLLDEEPGSPTYGQAFEARAKGLFARANEDVIMIRFEYLFETSNPNAEVVVYLTDSPELLGHDDPDRDGHYIEVVRLRPPPADRPGSAGSGRFGIFQCYAWRGGLDFLRGTRIELELLGPAGSSILINNWDPQVHCNPLYCADITGDWSATQLDYLTVLAHVGCRSELPHDGGPSLVCLDMGFGADGYVDSVDAEAWDWRLSLPDPHFCDLPLVPSSITEGAGGPLKGGGMEAFSARLSSYPTEGMLISGKRMASKMEDRHYIFDSDGRYISGITPMLTRANGKLIKDSAGELYQVNHAEGLVRLCDGASIIPPGTTAITFTDPRYDLPAEVRIGLAYQNYEWSGCPILDGVFDPDGEHVYIAPVVVVPDGQEPYQAAAKLRLLSSGNPPYEVVQLYDDPPAPGDNQNRNNLRDIELDRSDNLYVTNADSLNESDTLWVFDTDSGVVEQCLCLGRESPGSYVPAPTAMHVTDRGLLYLASALQQSDSNSVSVYVFSAATLSLVREITINNMGHVTAIAEDTSTGIVWVAGFTMADVPEYIDPLGEPFYKPYLARIPVGGSGPIEAECLSDPDTYPDSDLVLPLSLVSIASSGLDCGRPNIDGIGMVDLFDFARLATYWLDAECGTCDGADLTADGSVDPHDLIPFTFCWLHEGP